MSKELLLNTRERITPYIHKTPVLTSESLNRITGSTLYFKCENFQKMGAFKMRGAINAVMQLSDAQKQKGVVTHSSGNFAQAVSLAALSLRIKAYIVMPKSAPKVKVEAVKGYGGHVTMCDSTIEARESAAQKIMDQTGATFIHPSNDINVIHGNATVALELFDEHPNLDYLLSPIGGGGLIAGTALAAYHFGNDCQVIGAEPSNVDDAFRSLKSGQIEYNQSTNTIADGLRTHLGDINFPIIQKHVYDILRVNEDDIIEALKLIWERMKIIVEPSSAVALAAVIKNKDRFEDKALGVILSGGNVDLKKLPF